MREQVIPSGEKQCGIHVNPFDPNDIAWGIKQILEKKDKGIQMGKNGRERVIKEFSWDDELDIYLSLPGNFVETNLEYVEDRYIYQLTLSKIKNNGGIITIHTARFLPATYITIYFVLVILIFLFIKSVFFNKS